MPRSRTSPIGLALALAVTLPLVTAPAAQASAVVTELVGLPGYPTHRAIAVNDLGQIVGGASGNGAPRAVQWGRGTAVTDLGPGTPTGLNQVGQVLGLESVRNLGPYALHPRIWYEGKVYNLTPPGAGYVGASAINNRGVVPMTYSSSPSGYHQELAAVWRDGRHTSLPVSGAHLSLGAINDAGVIVGSKTPMFGTDVYAFRCVDTTRCERLADAPGTGSYSVWGINEAGVIAGNRGAQALRWDGGRVTVLSTSGAVAIGPQSLNERGDIVGWSTEAGTVRRATLWPGAGGKPVDLGVPGPSEAVAVNERGDVIGWTSADNLNAPRAFLWRNGKFVYLPSLGGTHSRPVALNDRGTIIGESTTAGGTLKPVRWNLITTTPTG